MLRKYVIWALIICLIVPLTANALTVSQLLDRQRLRIGETDSTMSYFTNAQLRAYSNDAIQFLSGFGIGVVKTNKIVGVAGQYDYNLPSDYINWLSVIIPDIDDTLASLVYVEPELFGKSYTGLNSKTAIPKEFTVLGDTIISFSPPFKYANDTIYLKYVASPASLDSMSQSLDLNYIYQLLIVDYVWAEWNAKNNDIEKYNAIMEMILNRIELYRKQVNLKSSQPAKIPEIQQ